MRISNKILGEKDYMLPEPKSNGTIWELYTYEKRVRLTSNIINRGMTHSCQKPKKLNRNRINLLFRERTGDKIDERRKLKDYSSTKNIKEE